MSEHDPTGAGTPAGFEPPPLVWETLGDLRASAEAFAGGAVHLTVGTPTDPPPPAVVEALGASGRERSYPPSVGDEVLRAAAAAWVKRRFGASIGAERVAATVGSKELVAGLPQWLRLGRPERDTVLYPEPSYPTYEMGARLAGLRAVAVPRTPAGTTDLAAISAADVARALCLWVNSPANPTGALDDLASAASWGRDHDVVVCSDECYAEFTWDGPPRSVLDPDPMDGPVDTAGVLAVHSLSKRSNLAGLRAGFVCGDADWVAYLAQVRKHAGLMVPGPVQAAAAVALGDDDHVDEQRSRYRHRLAIAVGALRAAGFDAELPGGAFYLWVPAPGGDGTELTRWFAEAAGTLVTPGAAYGPAGRGFIRLAMVRPPAELERMAERLGAAGPPP